MGAAQAASLSGWELYWLGVAGAFIAGLLVFVLPPLAVAQRTGKVDDWSRTRVYLTLGLVVLYSLVGGAGPFVVASGQADTAGKAIVAGLQAQALLKALVAAGSEATAPVAAKSAG